jgi:hypothetical protein
MSNGPNNTVLVFKEEVVKDEFGLTCCSIHNLLTPSVGLGECPECHTLWRNNQREDGKWSRGVCWFCPSTVANKCPFIMTPTCKDCKSAIIEKYPVIIVFPRQPTTSSVDN